MSRPSRASRNYGVGGPVYEGMHSNASIVYRCRRRLGSERWTWNGEYPDTGGVAAGKLKVTRFGQHIARFNCATRAQKTIEDERISTTVNRYWDFEGTHHPHPQAEMVTLSAEMTVQCPGSKS